MNFQELYDILINEDAIENIDIQGDWNDNKLHGYDKASIKMMQNPLQAERIKSKWSKLETPIDLYIVKGKNLHKFYELGRVDYYFVRDKMGLNINHNDDHITLILTNNKGDEKIPLTPWTIAHRFGHAFAKDTVQKQGSDYFYNQVRGTVEKLFKEIARIVYGLKTLDRRVSTGPYSSIITPDRELKKLLAQALGTFKSARDNNIRNSEEFTNELIAQYIITGKIVLNSELPKMLIRKYAWGKPQGINKQQMTIELQQELEDTIYEYQNSLFYDIESLFTSNIGHIFVM
jgi:hypothetical protein